MVFNLLSRIFVLGLLAVLGSAQASAENVLLIGDSHTVGEFGQQLHRRLEGIPGSRVASYGSWGSSPQWWLDGTPTNYRLREWDWDGSRQILKGSHATPVLAQLARRGSPEFVIVALGSNLLGGKSDWIDESTRRLMREARASAGRACVWIGPPVMRVNGGGKHLDSNDYDVVYSSIARAAAEYGCAWVDSREFAKYPVIGGDGIHFDTIPFWGKSMARAWADKAYDAVRAKMEMAR